MKRKTLLIGNNNGLQGVNADLCNWEGFLMSDVGGAWKGSEFETLINIPQNELLEKLEQERLEKYDFVIVVFCGHGNYTRQTNLILNQQGESIREDDIYNIAPRQINVFDCCRATGNEDDVTYEATKLLTEGVSFQDIIRKLYEERITHAREQQTNLYACNIGECAFETLTGGGYYTKNLLDEARQLGQSPFLTVDQVHINAACKTAFQVSKDYRRVQQPQIINSMPEVPYDEQLILSINPNAICI